MAVIHGAVRSLSCTVCLRTPPPTGARPLAPAQEVPKDHKPGQVASFGWTGLCHLSRDKATQQARQDWVSGEGEGQQGTGGRRWRGMIILDRPEQQTYSDHGAHAAFLPMKRKFFSDSPWTYTFQSCYFPIVNRTF